MFADPRARLCNCNLEPCTQLADCNSAAESALLYGQRIIEQLTPIDTCYVRPGPQSVCLSTYRAVLLLSNVALNNS